MVKKITKQCFPGKMRNKRRMFTLINSVQHCIMILASKIRQEKEIKDVLIGKEIKLSLFADGFIVLVERLIKSMKTIVELKNEIHKVAEYKILKN